MQPISGVTERRIMALTLTNTEAVERDAKGLNSGE